MKRVKVNHFKETVNVPLQFAYKKGRGTGETTLTLINTVSKHLQQHKSYAKLLFIDFCSSFKFDAEIYSDQKAF